MEENNSNPTQSKAKKVFGFIGLFVVELIFLVLTCYLADLFTNTEKPTLSDTLDYWWLYTAGALITTVIVIFINSRKKNKEQRP